MSVFDGKSMEGLTGEQQAAKAIKYLLGRIRTAPAPPQLQRVNVPLRLPRWLVEWIDQQEGTRADVIEAALLKAHKLRQPKE